jgi:molecular chaperone HtpG
MSEELDIQIDVQGFVSFMRRLFKTRNVYIRELIQNSLESIHAVNQCGEKSIGIIDIESDSKTRRVRVIDNGIGMSEFQLRDSLTRVFKSGWETQSGTTLGIGQFGFGFFSSLLVSNDVRVYTRSFSDPDRAWLWHFNFESALISIKENQGTPTHSGTVVELHLNEDAIEGLDTDYIIGELRTIFLYTTSLVRVNGLNAGIPTLDAWQRSLQDPSAIQNSATWLKEHYNWDNPPLYVHSTGNGFLVIAPPRERVPGIEVFRRGIRVVEQELIEPPLNSAICGLFNVEDLELCPDRENLAETPRFFKFKESLNQQVHDCLEYIAKEHPQIFGQICKYHRGKIVEASHKSQGLRAKIGSKIPLKVIANGKIRESIDTSLSMLLENSCDTPMFIWTDDPVRDGLIVDRFNVLGQPVLLLTNEIEQALAQHIAEDMDISFKSAIAAYVENLRESVVSDSSLISLFVDVVPDSEVLCCHDADTRLPVRMLILKSTSTSQNSDLKQMLLKALSSLLDIGEKNNEEHRVLAVNLSHPAIQALSDVITRDGISEKARKTADVLVFLSKTASQQSMERNEFDRFTKNISDLIAMLMS